MSETPKKKGLPRHVIGAAWTVCGFVGGITLLLVLPKYFGVPPKLAGFIAMVAWLASTWVFWTGGEAPPKRPEQPVETPPVETPPVETPKAET